MCFVSDLTLKPVIVFTYSPMEHVTTLEVGKVIGKCESEFTCKLVSSDTVLNAWVCMHSRVTPTLKLVLE